MKAFSMLITGDLVINKTYQPSHISKEIIDLFNRSDLNITNLEAPVTSSTSKIIKTGPHIKANKENTFKILETLKIGVTTLANNHILDYDEEGVKDTLNFCIEKNIKSFGAGINLKEASRTLFIDSPAGKIAFVNFAENEWASATEKTAGANPMNIIDNAKQIKCAKDRADFVFVIVHGGHEHYNLPSPRIQKQYRFYAEQGADMVIGHHTHCISGHEIHQNVPIFYSLGNFLFTKSSINDEWYLGLVLEIEIENEVLTTNLHPVKQEKESFELSLLESNEKIEILKRISLYNSIIVDESKLKEYWDDFVESQYHTYLNYWTPTVFIKNRYVRGLFNKLGIRLINKRGIAYYLNLMRCEAHADISKIVTKKYLLK